MSQWAFVCMCVEDVRGGAVCIIVWLGTWLTSVLSSFVFFFLLLPSPLSPSFSLPPPSLSHTPSPLSLSLCGVRLCEKWKVWWKLPFGCTGPVSAHHPYKTYCFASNHLHNGRQRFRIGSVKERSSARGVHNGKLATKDREREHTHKCNVKGGYMGVSKTNENWEKNRRQAASRAALATIIESSS